MEHKKQREFIRSIERVAEKANAAYGRVHYAMQIAPGYEEANKQYMESLNNFIGECNKMILQVQMSFGEGISDINLQRAANERLKPYTQN